MAYATANDIYDKVGVTSTELPEAQINRIIANADAEVDRIIKTTCVPKKYTWMFDGDNNNLVYLKNIPLLTVNKLEIDDTTIDIDDITFNQAGQVRLKSTADKSFFYASTTPNNCRIQYTYAWLEQTTVQSDSTVASVAGTDETLTVGDGSLFSENDWVLIEGFDGYQEAAMVKSVDTNDLTLDLVVPHEIGSTVTKLQVPLIITQLANVIGAIMAALKMIGSTYTFATSYSVPDYQVTKGVPHPHFSANLQGWVKERDFLISQIAPWPSFS